MLHDVSKKKLTILSSHIKHLSKSPKKILTALPDEIGELKELERLDVRLETGD